MRNSSAGRLQVGVLKRASPDGESDERRRERMRTAGLQLLPRVPDELVAAYWPAVCWGGGGSVLARRMFFLGDGTALYWPAVCLGGGVGGGTALYWSAVCCRGGMECEGCLWALRSVLVSWLPY
jgi:hypothetical protein